MDNVIRLNSLPAGQAPANVDRPRRPMSPNHISATQPQHNPSLLAAAPAIHRPHRGYPGQTDLNHDAEG